MSSAKSDPTESNALGNVRGHGELPAKPPLDEPMPPQSSRNAAFVVAAILVLLAALVWGLNPRQPKLTPAPLQPESAGCPQLPRQFVPSNITEIPQWQASPAKSADAMGFTGLSHDQKERVLLRLNTEPCTCGCKLSIAACRVNEPDCGSSGFDARRILDSIGH